jgi:hypothetical protein
MVLGVWNGEDDIYAEGDEGRMIFCSLTVLWPSLSIIFFKNRAFCVSEKRDKSDFHGLIKVKTMNMVNREPDGGWTKRGLEPIALSRARGQRRREAGCWRWLRPGWALSEGDDGRFRQIPVLSGDKKKRSGHKRTHRPDGVWTPLCPSGRVDSGCRSRIRIFQQFPVVTFRRKWRNFEVYCSFRRFIASRFFEGWRSQGFNREGDGVCTPLRLPVAPSADAGLRSIKTNQA